MRCLIVDDERLARQEMQHLLSMESVIDDIHLASNVKDAVQRCRTASLDVVFLDIQLRGESGFDFLDLAPHPLPSIVFVTAFDQYAIQAFNYHALDYLLKPVHPQRLKDTMARLTPAPSPSSDKGLLIRFNHVVRKVQWNEINAIESLGNYTRITLADGASTLVLRPLKEWMAIAPSDFVQVHRTAIMRYAAMREIRTLEGGRREIVLASNQVLPMSRSGWAAMKQRLH